MNYRYLGSGLLYLKYAYVDLDMGSHYVADSLFRRHKVPIKYEHELVKTGEKYRIICCKIKKKYKTEFEKALGEIKNKMYLLGYSDYETFCDTVMKP